MAKRRHTLALEEMEAELGYKIDLFNYPDESVRTFYSDLRLVQNNVYERTKRNSRSMKSKGIRYRKRDAISEKVLPDLGIEVSRPQC